MSDVRSSPQEDAVALDEDLYHVPLALHTLRDLHTPGCDGSARAAAFLGVSSGHPSPPCSCADRDSHRTLLLYPPACDSHRGNSLRRHARLCRCSPCLRSWWPSHRPVEFNLQRLRDEAASWARRVRSSGLSHQRGVDGEDAHAALRTHSPAGAGRAYPRPIRRVGGWERRPMSPAAAPEAHRPGRGAAHRHRMPPAHRHRMRTPQHQRPSGARRCPSYRTRVRLPCPALARSFHAGSSRDREVLR